MAIDPGPTIPGSVISNWGVLKLPKVLAINLGRNAKFVSAACVLPPFIRTGMTEEYIDNPDVFGRWQPRMLETHEAGKAFMQLMSRPQSELDQGIFELMVDGPATDIRLSWKKVHVDLREESLHWSENDVLRF
jgi:hypothetical protein